MELNGKIILKESLASSLIPTAVSDVRGVPGTLSPQSRVITAVLEMMPPLPRVKVPGSVG